MNLLGAGLVVGQLVTFAPNGYVGTFTVLDRSEARLRTSLGGANAVDLETRPSAVLTFNGRRSDASIGYGLRIAFLDIENSRSMSIANSARFGAGWWGTHRLRLDVGGDGSVGSQLSLGLLAPQTTSTATPAQSTAFVPPTTVLNLLTYRAQVSAAYAFSRMWQGQVGVAYSAGRGFDAHSRTVISPYDGRSGQIAATYVAGRSDSLSSRLGASPVYGPRLGSEFIDMTAMETWQHRWSLQTTGTLGAGVSFYRSRAAREAPLGGALAPAGEATLSHIAPLDEEESLGFQAASRLGVQYDAVLHLTVPQVSASTSATWRNRKLGMIASVDATTTLPRDPAQAPARQVGGALAGSYTPTRGLQLEAGTRGYVQILPNGVLPPGVQAAALNRLQWAVFVAMTVTAPPLEF